jgi:hypothetical protein
MSVYATACELCCLPVQHDHWVWGVSGPYTLPPRIEWKLYRGPESGGWAPTERPFRFAPEHAWLRDAVAFDKSSGEIVRGVVHDGVLTAADGSGSGVIGEIVGEVVPYHHFCFETWRDAGLAPPRTRTSYESSWLLPYYAQLFEFGELCQDGYGWMLEDPRESGTSRARIEARLQLAPDSGENQPYWSGRAVRDENHGRVAIERYRSMRQPGERAPFAHAVLVWSDELEPLPTIRPELEPYERNIKAALEQDGNGVLVSSACTVSSFRFLGYVRDPEATHARLEAMADPLPASHAIEHDPAWGRYAEYTQR